MPRFSIVTAVYNVEEYLDEFIAGIDAQDFDMTQVEVVAVDDGSTDSSLAMLHAWAERASYDVTVLTKENGGQSTARNLGLDHARGEWVTFTDPDDVLDAGYLTAVCGFLGEHPETVMVACNLIVLQHATGELQDVHPLRHRFRGKARLRDLDKQPAYFFASAPVAFFRRSEIEAAGLRFDPEIRPNFEDGHFTCVYLLRFPAPLVGFVPKARYHYRKRADSSSTLSRSISDADRYTTVLRRGYLDALQRGAAARDGVPPEWLQNLIVYELSWIMSVQMRAGSTSSASVAEAAKDFHSLMRELLDVLDPDLIEGSPVSRLNRFWRDVLLHSYADAPWRSPAGRLTALDRAQGLVRLEYRYVGPAPVERCLSGGSPVLPVHAKVRDVSLLGRVVMHQRILWLPAAHAVRIQLDGRNLPLELEPPKRTTFVMNSQLIRRNLDRFGLRLDRKPAARHVPESRTVRGASLFLRIARSRPVRRRFDHAWVLMDRVHDAGDNGQRLFEYLRAERPDINAWFTLLPTSPEWPELRRRYGRRVVAYGSSTWKLMLLNAEHVLSSHADQPVTAPTEILHDLGVRPTWRFTFLQHGVIKDDLSNWLNPKGFDTFITSTRAEQESVAGDHTAYVYTTREVKLTGLPRFDRLRELGARFAPAERDLILVAPTWRNWLTAPTVTGSQERKLHAGFTESDFARQWLAFLSSPTLAEAAAAAGARVGFLPHPNLQSAMAELSLPDHVLPLTFEGNDVQEIFARTRVMVTDYSSMAFNAAYIDRPVVYFQFDRDRVLFGEHVGTQGYFDYELHGYGPVVTGVETAVAAVRASLDAGGAPSPLYQGRIVEAFPERDGRCCERVTAAVIASGRKVRH